MILIKNKLILFFTNYFENVTCKVFKFTTQVCKGKNIGEIMHSGISFTYSNNYETNLVLTHNLHCVKIPGTESYFSPVININEKAKFAEKTLNSSHDLDFSLTLNKLMLHYY